MAQVTVKPRFFTPDNQQCQNTFLSRVSTLARNIDTAFCLSVRLSVRHVPVLYRNGLTHPHNFCFVL